MTEFFLSNCGRRCQMSGNKYQPNLTMRTIRLNLFAALLGLVMAIGSGCATPDSGSYTLKQTNLDVETAMQQYRNANVAGSVTLAEQQNVAAAHKAFQQAFNQAYVQAGSNINAQTPLNVRQLADSLIRAIETIPE